jgi:hypothetical protein
VTPGNPRFRAFFLTKKRNESLALTVDRLRASAFLIPDDLFQRLLELPAGLGELVVQRRRFLAPSFSDRANGEALREPQLQKLDAAARAIVGRAAPVELCGTLDQLTRPRAIESRRERSIIGGLRIVKALLTVALNSLLEPAGDVPGDAIEIAAESAGPILRHPTERAILTKTREEHLLRRVVELAQERAPAPSRSQIAADDRLVAIGEVTA